MSKRHKVSEGYTLIELLVVISIVAALAVVGISQLGSRPSGSVRGILDEVEGVLAGAHNLAAATGRDVAIATTGNWSAATPLVMAYGDNSTAIAQYKGTDSTQTYSTFLQTPALWTQHFSFLVPGSGAMSRVHQYAGIVVDGSTWWSTAAAGSQAIGNVAPFNVDATKFGTLIGATAGGSPTFPNNLFKNNNIGLAVVSGSNKRFTSDFSIAVVALNNGNPVPSGPMGLLVVQNNGSTIYKFYNPGSLNGDGKWRRI